MADSHSADAPDSGADSSNPRQRVMSFNVRYDTPDDGDDAWPHRRDLVASVVRFHRPDLVGLQEPLDHQFAYLRDALPAYDWVGVGRVDGDSEGEYAPVGYLAARYDLLDSGTFWLSDTPERPGSVGWDAQHPRIVTWAVLQDRGTDTRFALFNTHFDHDGATARVESARLLARRVDSLAGEDPVLATGDFNCTPGSTPYEILTGGEVADDAVATDDAGREGRAFADARDVAEYPHHGPHATFGRFAGESDRRIDYVFVTDGVDVRQHGVLADHWDGQVPSDHYPVLVEFSFADE